MNLKLYCRICKDSHSATADNFPHAVYARQQTYKGKGKDRKHAGIKQACVGYICKKCKGKFQREKFIKEHNVTAKPGERVMDAIRNKIAEIKLTPRPSLQLKQPKQKETGWQKAKRWTKNRFFKRKESPCGK